METRVREYLQSTLENMILKFYNNEIGLHFELDVPYRDHDNPVILKLFTRDLNHLANEKKCGIINKGCRLSVLQLVTTIHFLLFRQSTHITSVIAITAIAPFNFSAALLVLACGILSNGFAWSWYLRVNSITSFVLSFIK
jgi:hypothetical protein